MWKFWNEHLEGASFREQKCPLLLPDRKERTRSEWHFLSNPAAKNELPKLPTLNLLETLLETQSG